MVRVLIFILLFMHSISFAEELPKPNIYETNCLPCHQLPSLRLDKIFFSYLIKYSSELPVKLALEDFLKNPNAEISAMSDEKLRRLGVKSKTNLNEQELREAIDIYWERHKVFGKLK